MQHKLPRQQQLPFLVRPNKPEDQNFILDCWIRSSRGTSLYHLIPKGVFYPVHRILIEKTLKRSRTLVCCPNEDIDQILGFMVVEYENDTPLCIHFAFIKKIFHRMGLFRYLVEEVCKNRSKYLFYTHTNRLVTNLMEELDISYNPHLFTNDEINQIFRRSISNESKATKSTQRDPYQGDAELTIHV